MKRYSVSSSKSDYELSYTNSSQDDYKDPYITTEDGDSLSVIESMPTVSEDYRKQDNNSVSSSTRMTIGSIDPATAETAVVDIEDPPLEVHPDENEASPDDANRAPPNIVAKLREYYVFPVVAVALHATQWGFFLWGLYHVNNSAMGAEAGKNIYGRVSPPLQQYWFLTVNYWPSCTDARSNTWRLVSYQFTHHNFDHILSNTIIGTFFTAAIELTHPFAGIFALTVYQLAVIFGALAFSYVQPYRGLIGSSSGVYGIIGSIIPHLIFDITYSPWPERRNLIAYMNLSLAATVLLILVEDIISYFVAYKENVAYTAHMAGWFVGIFLGCAFSLLSPSKYFEPEGRPNAACGKPTAWKYALGALGAAGFIGQFIFLIYNYRTNWPPVPLHAKDMPRFVSCCGELLDEMAHNSSMTIEYARESYSCTGDKFGIIRRTTQNAGGEFFFI